MRFGCGTWIRTKIDGVRVRCSTVELSPTRWKAKFGRIDVSEARRGRWLEIDRKEIARRNTLALVTPTERADYHLATPLLATPGEALGESIDLIVVATGKREQLSDEFFQPSGAARRGRRTDPPANRSDILGPHG